MAKRKVVSEGPRKSGWCMDEVVAHDLDRPKAAARYHGECRFAESCGCPNHKDDK